MLDTLYTFDKNTALNLSLHSDAGWTKAKNRVLLVFETIDPLDLRVHELLSCTDTKHPVMRVIQLAQEYRKRYGECSDADEDFSFRVFNYRSELHLHLPNDLRAAKEQAFGRRTAAAIEKMRPTHVLFCGPHAFSTTVTVSYPFNRIGWVKFCTFGSHECLATLTFDFFRLMEKDGAQANSLGMVAWHLSYLLNGKFPFDLSYVKPNPVYIDSREKFDSMMKVLEKSDFVGLDTETRNLTVLHNSIYTIQFSTNLNGNGYVLALDHPQTPWTAKQIHYFKSKIRKFFTTEGKPVIITMNGMFDLRVLRRALKMPIVRRKVWEITAGEHLLNEELSNWRNLMEKVSFGNLRAILCLYQNDFYFRAKFTKEDRSTTGEVSPDNSDFLKYAAMDVCCLFPLVKMQCKRASCMRLLDKSYLPFFKRHMLYEMSDSVHVLSCLDEFGSYIDFDYMNLLASSRSPYVAQLNEIKETIFAHPAAQEANRQLLAESGFKAQGLFGNLAGSEEWILNLGRHEHRLKLFLDVLKLKVVEKTPKGEPSIGKIFVKTYKDTNEVVDLFSQYQEVYKIYTSYVKSWIKILTTNPDCMQDHHLRPSYGFFRVDTGRISSQNPSLQVIPQHSKSASPLKRAFTAPAGHILVHYDYSAHEVRGWAIVSGDDNLADAFREGQKLRQQWIQNPTEEIKALMKTKGDIHIQNAHRFFNKWVTKDDPLRQAVKAVVFGVLYGSSVQTLGEQTKTGELGELRKELNASYHQLLQDKSNKDLQKKISSLLDKINDLVAEDRTDYAQHIVDTMFKTFHKGYLWTQRIEKCARERGYVYSPLGRIRRLMSTIIVNPKNKKIINKQIRRGSNAPIQGFASEIAMKAARLTHEAYYSELPILLKMLGIDAKLWDYKVECSRMVHDALYYAVPYVMVLPFIQITQYIVTYGIASALKEQFNITCNIEPEVEFETAVNDEDATEKWNWDIKNLLQNLMKNVDDGVRFGIIDDGDKAKQEILRPWLNKEIVEYLDSKYPLLNIHLAEKIYDSAKACYESSFGQENKGV